MTPIEKMTELMVMHKVLGEVYGQRLTLAAQEVGMTRPEADVLLFLNNNPGLDTARDITKYRGFSKAYVSSAVEGLLARGLITSLVDRKDRRCQRLSLTREALPLAHKLGQTQEELVANLFEGLTQGERDALRSTMDKVSANLMKMRKKERV